MSKTKHLPVLKIRPQEEKKTYQVLGYQWMVAVMILVGSLIALVRTWNLNGIPLIPIIIMSVAGLLSGILAQILVKRYWWGHFFWLLPWPFMFLASGMHGYLAGAQMWIFQMLERWNQLHDNAAAIVQVELSAAAVTAFSMLLMLACGQLVWLTVSRRNLLGNAVFGFSWTFVMLFGNTFEPLAAGLMLAGFFGVWFSEHGEHKKTDIRIAFAGRTMIWCVLTVVILGICVPVGYRQQITAMEDLRAQAKQEWQELRYGKDVLPQGDLRKADTLQQDTSSMLEVTSNQRKTMYLKGFVGAIYEDGQWKKMPRSAYGGDYAGMMKWLRQKNFDPLTQVSDYYALSRKNKEKDIPDQNRVQLNITNASRYYMYTPSSVGTLKGTKTRNLQDTRIAPGTFIGKNRYTMTETSTSAPAELTVAKNWIHQPKTGAQTTYTEAEAVYRDFVYNNYLSLDEKSKNLMTELFWKDYKSDSDGIYSALCQIREVLDQKVSYTETPQNAPEAKDPIDWFLNESRQGNSMLYASVAVQAFRAHGIPARYVEGYYAGSDDLIQKSEWSATLTGESAHAWAEVYFDGIGWLPLDVTPGYYYDAVELQKMVGKPNASGQNTNPNKNSYDANAVTDANRGSGGAKKKVVKAVLNIAGAVLGILAMVVIFLSMLIVIGEVVRLILAYRKRKQYETADMEERAVIIEKKMYAMLAIIGIDGCLGWNTDAIEDQLQSFGFSEIQRGDYARCCQILEKSIYGGMPIELYEERTLLAYLEDLKQAAKHCGWIVRMKMHFASDRN